MITLQIRYLKVGLIEADIDKERLDNMSEDELHEWAGEILCSASGRELSDGLSDEPNQGMVVFSDIPLVEAVEEEGGETLLATNAWLMWAHDPKGIKLADLDLEEN